MDDADRHLVFRIAESIAPLDREAFEPVMRAMRCSNHDAGDTVIAVGERGPREFFVLSGILKTFVGDADGREATLGFHVGPGIMTPAIARVTDDCSRVNCVAMTGARVASFPSQALVDCMVANPAVQRWGDAVLRGELMRRADREWALVALPATQRLLRFRQEHGPLEDLIAHHHIASYLGITPVTLSRIRAQLREA
jgi:CRP-like cAMP-binding protein